MLLLFFSVPFLLSIFYSFLLFFLLPVLFYHSLFIHFILWSPLLFPIKICYPFFSSLFSYYSILSVFSLCYITIQSVLFLLEPFIWYFFATSIALASVFFILLLFFKDLMTLPALYSYLSLFSLFLYPFSALFMLLFCSCFCSFLFALEFSFSVLVYPLFYMLLLFLLLIFFYILTPSFFIYFYFYLFLFSFLFSIFIIFLVLYFVCIALQFLPTD